MKVEKIFYQKLFPTGPYSNEKIGVEVIVEPGETAEDCLTAAKNTVSEWHKQHNPDLYTEQAEIRPEKPLPEDKRIAVLIRDIQSCTELVVLDSYRILVKTNSALEEAYNIKRKEIVEREKEYILRMVEKQGK